MITELQEAEERVLFLQRILWYERTTWEFRCLSVVSFAARVVVSHSTNCLLCDVSDFGVSDLKPFSTSSVVVVSTFAPKVISEVSLTDNNGGSCNQPAGAVAELWNVERSENSFFIIIVDCRYLPLGAK